jgi:hypothetical protein
VTSEPRSGGPQRIEVDFTQPIALTDDSTPIAAAGSDGNFYDSTSTRGCPIRSATRST